MIRQVIRSLRNAPGFTTASILALALGIGANTAIFSLVNAILLRPLPYKDARRLVMLLQRNPDGAANDASAADFEDWRNRSHAFEQLSAVLGASFNLTEGDRPERISGLRVTASFFSTLGVMPALGGVFGSDEEQPGAERSVVLSDTLWRRRFGAGRDTLGKTIHLDRRAYKVVGVMPAGFQFFGGDNEVWLPLPLEPNRGPNNYYNLTAIARLKPGVGLFAARSEMDGIARQLAVEYPKSNQGWGIEVTPLREKLTGNIRLALLVLLGAVAFVLLIACGNVANLLLVRAAGRQKEFAIRTALGGGRLDIARRLLLESISLAVAAGLLGVLLAHWGITAIIALSPSDLPRLTEVGIDWRVLAFTTAISLLTGILFGLAPAAQFTKLDISEALNEGGRGMSESARGRFTRSLLVVTEVALALILLIGAGLMIRSLRALETTATGFPTGNLLTMNFSIPVEQYANEHEVAADFERALERIRLIPAVLSAAAATNLPVGGWNQGRVFSIEGRPPKPNGEVQGAGYLSVSPGYFRTAGLRLIRGREFTAQDRSGAPDVVIISESMARRYWPGENPIGKRIVCASIAFGRRRLGPPLPREIVGIVSDVHHVGRDVETSVEMYVPELQNTIPFTYFLVRTAGDPARFAPAVSRAVNEVLKDSPAIGTKTIDQRLSESFSRPRFQMLVLVLFAGLALLLATLGIYAVMSYSAAQRRHELGIRMALGADRRQILSLVLGNALKLTLTGVFLGVLGAIACTRLMASLLYNVATTDSLTFAGVSLVILFTGLLASFLPAWRAAKTDPAATLHSQL